MNTKKAIEILTDNRKLPRTPNDQDLLTAMELGIEALKRVEHVRTLHTPNPLDILPGETED